MATRHNERRTGAHHTGPTRKFSKAHQPAPNAKATVADPIDNPHRLGCACGCMSVPPWAFDPECASERPVTRRWNDCANCGALGYADLREATLRGLMCTSAFCVAELLWSERGWAA